MGVLQIRILSHDSVGGFVTRCGWSSVIEGLHFRHPLIMLPTCGDQRFNARTFDEKMVGIEIPRDEEGWLSRKSVSEKLNMVMVEETGKIYRNKAKEMSKLFGDQHWHRLYVSDFVEYLQKHRLVYNNDSFATTKKKKKSQRNQVYVMKIFENSERKC